MSNSPKTSPTVIIILIALICAGVAGYFVINQSQPEQTLVEEDLTPDDTLQTGSIELGATPYTLIATTGEEIHEKSFPKKYKLVYFGFTRCPDVCPTGLANITAAMTALGADADRIQPVFITVDPAYDTAQVMKDYLYNFDNRFIGATGTPDQIKAAQDSFRVYASGVQPPEAVQETVEPQNQPTPPAHDHAHAANADTAAPMINHSDYIYFMGKDGKLLNVFPGNTDGQSIASNMQTALAAELLPAANGDLPPAPEATVIPGE